MLFYEMIRNGKLAAHVVTLDNGKTVVSWPTSTIVYDTELAARAIHIGHMGGRGEHTDFRLITAYPKSIAHGYDCCLQDAYENCPFASVGGLEARETGLTVPDYVKPEDRENWMLGYKTCLLALYGSDWKTVTFAWKPALILRSDGTAILGEEAAP